MKTNRATLRDVAREAGVSIATVSHAINNSRVVNEATKQKICDVIERLNYQPNTVARELRTGSSGLLGALVIDHNPFYTDIVRGIEEEAEPHGFKLLVASTGESWARQREVIDILASRRVEGLLLAPGAGLDREAWGQVRARVPRTVFFDRYVQGAGVPAVVSANYSGGYEAASHLIRNHGFRKLFLLTGGTNLSSLSDREAGVREACNEVGAELRVIYGEATLDGGYQCAANLMLEMHTRSAFVIANNQMAIGALFALRNHGLSVPKDVAMVAFDYQPWTDLIDPVLTVVSQSTVEMGRMAVRKLLNSDDGSDQDALVHELPIKFRLGESCGCSHQLGEARGLGRQHHSVTETEGASN